MTDGMFRGALVALALGFSAFFAAVVIPPLLEDPDVFGALAAGFVNPYSSGYSTDVIFCWLILAVWVLYEANSKGVRNGWPCLLVGLVPGVAVGFAAYLLVRQPQLKEGS